jgi:DNA-binding winged helix-turn-helix (wHTH) protein/pimeloyl-ACP methyl ester carboxylesterase
MQAVSQEVLTFAGFTLDLRRGCVRAGDREIQLRPKSFAVLKYLVENAGRLVAKDELINAIWPSVIVTDESLTHCVSDVRRALSDSDQRLIRTVARRGYLFAASVTRVGDQTAVIRGDPSPPPKPAERRQITVLSCELVEANELSAHLDPEDLERILAAYHGRCTDVVEQLGGLVTPFSGEGVLAYFGVRLAREDDAERAVMAGLNIVAATAKIDSVPAVHARVGIATGVGLVCERNDRWIARKSVVGETPNLACGVRHIAEPGSVLIADSTRRLIGDLFECRELAPVVLRGFHASVRTHQVRREKTCESRFKALHGTQLTSLVGRRKDLDLLLDRWGLAKSGEGQIVWLSGEPGIGKSRLVQALDQQLGADGGHQLMAYQCSPERNTSALHPVITQLEHAAGFCPRDVPLQKHAKLEALLQRDVQIASEFVPLFASLLALPSGERCLASDLTPAQRSAKTLEALVRHLEACAARRPVLLIFEDLHWADPTSIELLELLVERTRQLAMLAVFTFRTDFVPPWSRPGHVTLLSLNRLGRGDAAALAERVAGGRALPAEVMNHILFRSDGVPLFIEELTRLVLKSELVMPAGDRYVSLGRVPDTAIPTTLHGALTARLDRVASAKEVAQLAACIGREFAHEILATASTLEADELRAALQQLSNNQLIDRSGLPSRQIYVFRHALVQEAAYQSIPKTRRRELHARIADAIEADFPELIAHQPEWLAHHHAEAGHAERASECLLDAARLARSRYALREAAAHLEKCIGILRTLRTVDAAKGACIAERRELEPLEMLGDLASLMDDLAAANSHYDRALMLGSSDDGIRIERKRHRPHAVFRGGARIAYYEHGGGDITLLLVSPLAYGLAAIQPVLEQLCQEFRIITIDPRGSGASDPLTRPYHIKDHASDIRAVIAELGGNPLVGVGISAGANMLLRLAHAEPNLFSHLITLGAPPSDLSRAFYPAYLERCILDQEMKDIAEILRLHIERVFSEPEMHELRERTIRSRLSLPRETILSFFDPDPTKDVMPLLAGISTPVLVTHGREDRVIAFAAAEGIAVSLPNARLYPFERKGHLPIFTATSEFCNVVRRFVRGSLG